jgi:hypothetical protein
MVKTQDGQNQDGQNYGSKQGLPRVLVILAIFDHLEIDQRDRER